MGLWTNPFAMAPWTNGGDGGGPATAVYPKSECDLGSFIKLTSTKKFVPEGAKGNFVHISVRIC